MSVEVYSIPGQTGEGRRKAFLEWKSMDLSYKLSFAWDWKDVGRGWVLVMLTILKVSIILFVLVGTGTILEIFKINQ